MIVMVLLNLRPPGAARPHTFLCFTRRPMMWRTILPCAPAALRRELEE
jgi:hypothetical protein